MAKSKVISKVKLSKEQLKKIESRMIEQLATLITAAFGFVAALAWNSAIQKIFEHFFGNSDTLIAMLIYAVSVTVIAVLVTIWIGRIAGKSK